MKKKHKKGTYFLDLADNGYWLIKSEAGYRECIGVGDEGKKVALEKIERLNKGGKIKKNHRHKWKKIMLTSAPFAEGSYMWWCKKCNSRALTQERPDEKISEEKPEVTEAWIEEKARGLLMVLHEAYKDDYLDYDDKMIPKFKDFIRSLVEDIPGKKPIVSEEYVKKYYQIFLYMPMHEREEGLPIVIKRMLKEAGVKVKK